MSTAGRGLAGAIRSRDLFSGGGEEQSGGGRAVGLAMKIERAASSRRTDGQRARRHVCALAGYDVVVETSMPRFSASRARLIEQSPSQACGAWITQADVDAAMTRIPRRRRYFGDADRALIIEAATARRADQAQLFQDLCTRLNPHTMLATNTSSISITRLRRGDRTGPSVLLGLHFMNPAPDAALEVIRGHRHGDDTFASVLELVRKVGKRQPMPRFSPPHRQPHPAPMINERSTRSTRVGSREAIDTAMRLGANHPMGPLQLADFIGLDTCLSVMQVLYEGLADSKYRPCPLLVPYVEAGWLGRKTDGRYDYAARSPSRRVEDRKRDNVRMLWLNKWGSQLLFDCWRSLFHRVCAD